MTFKDKDRRRAFWAAFIYIMLAPIGVTFGMNLEATIASIAALASGIIANYFSAPTNIEG